MSARPFALAAIAALGVVVGAAPARPGSAETAVKPRPEPFEVEKFANVAYRTGADADPDKHRLDVYMPAGQKEAPVLLFVHGGAWKSGNKSLYIALGQAFAKQGIVTVVINYRLSPKVKHPAHAEDVAAAFAWTHKHIAKYGGDPERITLMGHSAGGHLVALIATDPEYLRAEKLAPANIHGVIGISGVYRIVPNSELFKAAFGNDPELCRNASPLEHVSGSHPPFLIAYADKDMEHLDELAADMNATMEKFESPTTLLRVPNRNHITIIVSIIKADDPLNQAVRDFVLGK